MANLTSQIKRNRQNEKRRLRNRNYRGAARTAVSQARKSMETGAANSKEALLFAISLLDKAAERGTIHRNNAARRKGRLMKRLAALNAMPAPGQMAETAQAVESTTEGEAMEPSKKGPAKKSSSARKSPAKKSGAKKTAKK